MRTYSLNGYKTKNTYLWKRLILGLIWVALLAVSPSYLGAQEAPQTIDTSEAAAETALETVTKPALEELAEPVFETAPTPESEQESYTAFLLPSSREGMGAESWYYEAKRLEQFPQGEGLSEEAQELLEIGRASCRERV